MGDIIKMTSADLTNPEVRKHMELFWAAHDKLLVDMETIPYEEFEKRNKEMWAHRNDGSKIEGDLFLISLWGFSRKAHEIYGSECDPFI
jgi:hypothetical protein